MNSTEALVTEAYRGTRWSSRGCFTSNAAAGELDARGTEALDAIESVTLHNEPLVQASLGSQFPNVASVMVAYTRIAKHLGDHTRAIRFMHALPSSVRQELLNAIFITWCCNARAPGVPVEMREQLEAFIPASDDEELKHLQRILDHDP